MAPHQLRILVIFTFPEIYFCLFDLVMQQTGTIRNIIKEGLIRIIPAMFGQNQARSLGGNVL